MRTGCGTPRMEMPRCGATLPEVGQVLRHRHAATTECQGRPRGAQADRAPVAGTGPVSTLRESVAEYLAVRQGARVRAGADRTLSGQFLDYLDATGLDRITVKHAVAWRTPGRGQHWHAMRLGAVRGFARYLHEVDPRVEVPAADLLPDKSGRAVPYLRQRADHWR